VTREWMSVAECDVLPTRAKMPRVREEHRAGFEEAEAGLVGPWGLLASIRVPKNRPMLLLDIPSRNCPLLALPLLGSFLLLSGDLVLKGLVALAHHTDDPVLDGVVDGLLRRADEPLVVVPLPPDGECDASLEGPFEALGDAQLEVLPAL